MNCSCWLKKILIPIQKFWNRNQNEIIESIIDTRLSDKTQEELDEQKKKACVTIRVPLKIGVLYLGLGTFLLKREKIDSFLFIGIELIVLGIYALLFSLIFYCEKDYWRELRWIKGLKSIFCFFMLPYHLCIKKIKKFIKDSRQEHVIYLFPYYFLSLFCVAISFGMIVMFFSVVHINEVYSECKNFFIVLFLIFEFFLLGKLFAYLTTKQTIRSVQKLEIKHISKVNWRGIFNDAAHKKERYDKFTNEWELVKKELEYTKIYFYIILTILILWIPKTEGTAIAEYVNDFFGITTIAALAREAKAKKADEEGIILSD